MQYLKDEVRNKIIEEALREFKSKGYKHASIRSIAKNSNTSVGNLYKYFNGKEDLYENIIGTVYYELMDYVNQFNKVKIDEKSGNIFYNLMEKIMKIFERNSMELSILLNKSEGSKYENCKCIFVEFITRIVTESMKYELKLQGRKLKDNFIIYILSYNLMESIAIILREKENGIEVRKLISDIIDIFYKDIINKLDSEIV